LKPLARIRYIQSNGDGVSVFVIKGIPGDEYINVGYRKLLRIDQFDPIPLTPEWLDKLWLNGFSFKKQPYEMSGCEVWQLGIYRILYPAHEGFAPKDYALCIDGISPPTYVIARMDYVHELQNVIYELTKKELTIKDKNESK
jgi:hypothetical protein